MMSFLIVILFVAGSIGLIVVACNVKDDYLSEQDWEKAIIELENKLNTTDCVEELRFTPKDILLKRDIDFINKVKLNKEIA